MQTEIQILAHRAGFHSQTTLSSFLGVSRWTAANWYSGKSRPPAMALMALHQHAVLKNITFRFRSAIGAGGKVHGDDEVIQAAQAVLGSLEQG